MTPALRLAFIMIPVTVGSGEREDRGNRWVIAVFGIIGFLVAYLPAYSVAIQPGHTLVTMGIYGVIRTPSYLGLLVNSLGWALA